MFKLIQGTKKPKVNKHKLYVNACVRTLEAYKKNPNQKDTIKKLSYYGVRVVNTFDCNDGLLPQEIEFRYAVTEIVKRAMELLTPNELITLFPVTKVYDGKRYETKDYFYTMEYLNGLNMNEPIGCNIEELLWDYCNWDLRIFGMKCFGILSDLRRANGQPGLMEEWAEMNGISTYTLHKDSKGKEFLFDKKTGKCRRVKRARPKYIKVV